MPDIDEYVLVYSITSKSSFRYIREMIKEINGWKKGEKAAIIVVANKLDLVRKRTVSEHG